MDDAILEGLTQAYWHATSQTERESIQRAKYEITRLRAAQFRWIPVTERLPNATEVNSGIIVFPWLFKNDWYLGSGNSVSFDHRITHWAPVPPPSEETQIVKDQRAYLAYMLYNNPDPSRFTAKDGFMAGLKAARGEKP